MSKPISRRVALAGLAAVVTSGLVWGTRGGAQTKAPAVQAKTPVLVYKDANCGCCQLWVKHMEANGFAVTVKDTTDLNGIKRARRIAEPLWSCHTSHIGGYIVEGHVPASDIRKLLAQKPKGIMGLTIPGMPASAPGMDLKPFQPYTVLTFDENGKTTVFAKHDKE